MNENNLLIMLNEILKKENNEINNSEIFTMFSLTLLHQLTNIYLNNNQKNSKNNFSESNNQLTDLVNSIDGNELQNILPLLMNSVNGNGNSTLSNLMKMLNSSQKKKEKKSNDELKENEVEDNNEKKSLTGAD